MNLYIIIFSNIILAVRTTFWGNIKITFLSIPHKVMLMKVEVICHAYRISGICPHDIYQWYYMLGLLQIIGFNEKSWCQNDDKGAETF